MRRAQPPLPARIFIDTAGYYAAIDAGDERHGAAAVTMEDLAGSDGQLFSTNYVVAEIHALTVGRHGPRLGARVLAELEGGAIQIIYATPEHERRAREILVQYDDKAFSLADAVIFAVMERLRIPAAFTFDRNFVQFGLQVMPAPPGS